MVHRECAARSSFLGLESPAFGRGAEALVEIDRAARDRDARGREAAGVLVDNHRFRPNLWPRSRVCGAPAQTSPAPPRCARDTRPLFRGCHATVSSFSRTQSDLPATYL